MKGNEAGQEQPDCSIEPRGNALDLPDEQQQAGHQVDHLYGSVG